MTVQEFMTEKGTKTERALVAYLDTWQGVPDALCEAVRYSLFAGGKRLRPALALGAAEVVSGDDEAALPAACALEMIHTYSLIHDDLPAMDDDDLRRGKPALHKVYGDALAILAGDALLTMAFDVLARTNDPQVVQEIAQAAGAAGMVGGQVIDLESEGKPIQFETLRRMHACKTGALIRASVRSGAMLARARPEELDALTRFAEHIGLAFQITDDLLDITGTEQVLGKPIGSAAARKKATYPALVGLNRARELAQKAAEDAIAALAPFGVEADLFRALARFTVERDR